MAAASASALPANMVAEITRNVVSVMSRSTACTVPAGLVRQRCTCSCAAAVIAGTRAARSAGRNSGAAVRRCQRQLAPCEVRMPSPSVASNTCFSSGVLGNRSASLSRMVSISAGSVTQATTERPLSCTTMPRS
jgi:hypothetical protein